MKSRFRWMAVIMSVLLSLFIGFSLSSNQTQAAKKDSGTLKIGMEANYPPYNWTQPTKANGAVPIDGSNSYANGYDVQIAKIIGKRLHKKVIVEKINMVSKHVKPRKMGEQGGIIKAEGAMYASKVMPICPKCGKAVRVGHVEKDGKMVRVCKKCGAEL